MGRTRFSYEDQCKSLTPVGHDDPDSPLGRPKLAATRGALQCVERVYHRFFRGLKTGQKPGYPRFHRCGRYTTIEINDLGENQSAALPDLHAGHGQRAAVHAGRSRPGLSGLPSWQPPMFSVVYERALGPREALAT